MNELGRVCQLVDNEPFDIIIIKKDFLEIYHQQGANLNDPDQNVEFIFGENNFYHQSGYSYLEFEISVRNPACNFNNNSQIRIINNPYGHCFK